MSLASAVGELEAVLDVLDDARAHDQTARSLTEVTGKVSTHRSALAKLRPIYADAALPGRPGAGIDRWPVVLSKVDELAARARTAPETIRDGRLWTDTDSSLKALLRDITSDVRDRWQGVGEACKELLDTSLLAGLPPGTPGARRYREIAVSLAALVEKQVPQVGEASRAEQLVRELRVLRDELTAHQPPDALRADLALLEQCRLPPERMAGELKAYLERTGLSTRVRLGLIPLDD